MPQKFGNWLVTDKGIKWDGQPNHYPMIPKDRLNETGPGDREKMYDWLVHLLEKDWVKTEDVYTLNTAFIFALEYFEIGFSADISFVKTFKEQQKEIAEREAYNATHNDDDEDGEEIIM